MSFKRWFYLALLVAVVVAGTFIYFRFFGSSESANNIGSEYSVLINSHRVASGGDVELRLTFNPQARAQETITINCGGGTRLYTLNPARTAYTANCGNAMNTDVQIVVKWFGIDDGNGAETLAQSVPYTVQIP